MAESVRIDKWLWAVRLFKTRSLATEACKKGRVFMGDLPVKPSREIHSGDVVKVRKQPVTYSFKVLAVAEKRMSAKLTSDFVEDITPPEELEMLEMQKHMNWSSRERGAGRPTKKERRKLDDFFDF
ncbi:RNA-binding S4 domain-containing protein [Mariniphaga sediminis]|jgi:ribosome-associated heat shock protein Hsp15|uniref:RNA-binding S4 domain-containing protein n=2 Tax=Mariniphaga sediminis TaxID=1628158 RepID=A0A399D0Z8_9BACT|nr:RNA-binding S4 domain-containing protein [Mariniphaga sediminis]RIH65247.1 RNA-binding S4 domain-containing protein [Mariniphaga sediminis]